MVYPGAEYTPNTRSCSLTLTNASNTYLAWWRAMWAVMSMLSAGPPTFWLSTLDRLCSIPSVFAPDHTKQNDELLNRSELRDCLPQQFQRILSRAFISAVRMVDKLDFDLLSVPNPRHSSSYEHVIVSRPPTNRWRIWSQPAQDRAVQRLQQPTAGGSIRR